VIVPGTVSIRARVPFATDAISISCATIRSGCISIEPSGAFSASPLVPEGADVSFAALGSTDGETAVSGWAGVVQERMARTAGDTCDKTPPTATPMTRLAAMVRVRFIGGFLFGAVLGQRLGKLRET
jgi:hypothetical protein